MHPLQCPSNNIWDGRRRKLQLATIMNSRILTFSLYVAACDCGRPLFGHLRIKFIWDSAWRPAWYCRHIWQFHKLGDTRGYHETSDCFALFHHRLGFGYTNLLETPIYFRKAYRHPSPDVSLRAHLDENLNLSGLRSDLLGWPDIDSGVRCSPASFPAQKLLSCRQESSVVFFSALSFPRFQRRFPSKSSRHRRHVDGRREGEPTSAQYLFFRWQKTGDFGSFGAWLCCLRILIGTSASISSNKIKQSHFCEAWLVVWLMDCSWEQRGKKPKECRVYRKSWGALESWVVVSISSHSRHRVHHLESNWSLAVSHCSLLASANWYRKKAGKGQLQGHSHEPPQQPCPQPSMWKHKLWRNLGRCWTRKKCLLLSSKFSLGTLDTNTWLRWFDERNVSKYSKNHYPPAMLIYYARTS